MRRILLAALALLLLTMPAHALEPDLTFGAEKLEHALDEETREALSGTSPTSAGDFGKELWHIVSSAISGAGLALRPRGAGNDDVSCRARGRSHDRRAAHCGAF